MQFTNWISNNYIEVFGAITGILYVFLEIRQKLWLWPVGIATSAVYIVVFFTSKFYADMSLQGYYLVISVLGWYWWITGNRQPATGNRQMAQDSELRAQSTGRRAQGEEQRAEDKEQADTDAKLPSLEGLGVGQEDVPSESEPLSQHLKVTRINVKTTLILTAVFIPLVAVMYQVLDRFTDSPVPLWDSFITSLSIIATWMLARKIYEHWYLWIIVNSTSVILFCIKGLYPTVVLYLVYFAMSFAGLREWKKSL
jgi:nicotinamide mononucleotide transporter